MGAIGVEPNLPGSIASRSAGFHTTLEMMPPVFCEGAPGPRSLPPRP
ncbi:MAG: hypothetical protein ACXQT2_03995 [Methanotrichaceae archaeon]